MRVADVMNRELPTVSPAASLRDALLLMRRKRVRHLVVVEQGTIVGVLSERDVGWGEDRVKDSMTAPAVTVPVDATLQQAANLMVENDLGCLPVLRNGRPVGILSTRDVLQGLARLVP